MSRKYKIRDQEKLYFVTFTVVNWIDVFIREEYRTIFLDSVKYCQKNKGLEVYAWCMMTSHIHMILGRYGENKLEDIIRDLKSHTSRQIRLYSIAPINYMSFRISYFRQFQKLLFSTYRCK